MKMNSISGWNKNHSPMPLSDEKALSAWGGSSSVLLRVGTDNKGIICAWQFLTFSCNYPFAQKPVVKWIFSPERHYLSWLSKHYGIKASLSEPCSSLILRGCFPSRGKKKAPSSKVGRLPSPTPPPYVSWKSLLEFVVGWGRGWLFLYRSDFHWCLHSPFLNFLFVSISHMLNTCLVKHKLAVRHIEKKKRWDAFFPRRGLLPLAEQVELNLKLFLEAMRQICIGETPLPSRRNL